VKHDSNCSDNIHLRCLTGHIGGKGYTPIATRMLEIEPGYAECERLFLEGNQDYVLQRSQAYVFDGAPSAATSVIR
jgi:hypothetical protein